MADDSAAGFTEKSVRAWRHQVYVELLEINNLEIMLFYRQVNCGETNFAVFAMN